MSKYLVTLKPVEAFFFGGERTFEFYDKNAKEELKNNIIKSMMFPQQTSILGMLRKELLIINDMFDKNWNYNEKEKIEKCIGLKGFDINQANEQEFGTIKKISPVFIAQINESNYRFFMKNPKDHNKSSENLKINKYMPFEFNENCKCKCNFGEDIYLPINYDCKKGISNDFVDIENGEIVKIQDIFKTDSYIGIKLNDEKITEENSLFRLEKYKFNYDSRSGKNDKAFAFTVDIDESVLDKNRMKKIDNYKNIVSLGGENSYFFIKFEKVDFDIIDKIKFLNCYNEFYKKIVLISDTYIDTNEYAKYCDYSIASSIDFRTAKRDKYEKTEGYYYKNFKRSIYKYSFLEKGSVLFVKEANYENLIRHISKNNLRKIGYNIFK